ncbi:MAG: hypothetical protein AAB967_01335 [Patescibacteria group bacterium]
MSNQMQAGLDGDPVKAISARPDDEGCRLVLYAIAKILAEMSERSGWQGGFRTWGETGDTCTGILANGRELSLRFERNPIRPITNVLLLRVVSEQKDHLKVSRREGERTLLIWRWNRNYVEIANEIVSRFILSPSAREGPAAGDAVPDSTTKPPPCVSGY